MKDSLGDIDCALSAVFNANKFLRRDEDLKQSFDADEMSKDQGKKQAKRI